MKKIFAILTTLALLLSMTACGKFTEETTATPETTAEQPTEMTQAPSVYADALAVLNAIWDATPEADRFSAFGGNQTENAVMDAPGAFELSDTNGLSGLLLVPEAVQGNLNTAASLVHMMNANTFTGAVLELKDADDTVPKTMVEAITTNQFMCGFPEKVVVLTLDHFVIYAFGAADLVDNFLSTATETLAGEVVVVCDQWMA